MAWLPMYLLEKDVEFLNDWINQEEEIAFLISTESKRWIAKKEHNILSDIGKQLCDSGHDTVMPNYAEYSLWHIPSGQLPLLDTNKGKIAPEFQKELCYEEGKIDNPWLGWTEIRTGTNSRIPYFGAGHPGIIHLEINIPGEKEIKMSSFSWIGNHFKRIGNGADQTTEIAWNKLRRMAKKIGTHIPRSNAPEGKKEVFAFPTAYEEIKNGRPCSLNP